MKKPKRTPSASIQKSMCVADIVALCPESKDILAEYGLHCVGCSQNGLETLQEGCRGHGFEEEEIDELVADLNEMIEQMPDRPASLVITAPAARAIRDVAEREGRTKEGLCVTVDGQGGFCMEFRPKAGAGEKTFRNAEEKDVRVFASTLTLKRIGGSVIDFREGRFKLDLLGEEGCACGGGSCTCSAEGTRRNR